MNKNDIVDKQILISMNEFGQELVNKGLSVQEVIEAYACLMSNMGAFIKRNIKDHPDEQRIVNNLKSQVIEAIDAEYDDCPHCSGEHLAN